MVSLQQHLPQFDALDAQVLGISTDSPYSHIAWQEHQVGQLGFPLLSDFYPHGAVATLYGIIRTERMPLPGITERTIYVVDKSGVITFAKPYELGGHPDIPEVLQSLEQLRSDSVPRRAVNS